MIRGKAGGDGSTSRLLIEKSTPKQSPEERDEEDLRASKIAEFIKDTGGKGKAKIYRVIDAEPRYAVTWPVDEDFVPNVEERLAELGGGKYYVKLFWGSKCLSSLTYIIDADTHPVKRTDPEQRRDGGVMPQTPAELQAMMTNTITATLAPILSQLQQPRSGESDMLKLFMMQQQQSAAELRELNAKLIDKVFAGPSSGGGNSTLRELSETVSLLDTIRGDRDRDHDPRYEKRSLALKLIDGPLSKGVERLADRVVDKVMPDDDDDEAPRRPHKSGAARAQPQQRAANVPPPPSPAQVNAVMGRNQPPPPAPRPPQMPPVTPTTPVHQPRGIEPLGAAELAAMRAGRVPRTATPAPTVAEAVPKAAEK